MIFVPADQVQETARHGRRFTLALLPAFDAFDGGRQDLSEDGLADIQ